jgi:hypothetical protein
MAGFFVICHQVYIFGDGGGSSIVPTEECRLLGWGQIP